MPAHVYEYTLIRLVPRVERGERLNVGVVLFCKGRRFLDAMIDVDEPRIRAFAPELDLEAVREALDAYPRVCRGGAEAGPLAEMDQAERFRWLAAPRSTVIQPSEVHTGEGEDPAAEMERLMATMVRSG